MVENSRHRRLFGFWRWTFLTASALSILLAVYQIFTLGIYTGFTPLTNQYLYGLVVLLLPPVFVLWPAWARAPRDRVPWYDAALFAVSLAVGLYYIVNG
ncbi:MAG: hypothetical protein V3U23_09585, partial [Kiloniellales bacterium]